jgi:hypothetical protein
VLRDVHRAENADGDEPRDHHRAKELSDTARPATLDCEEADEDHDGERHDVALEGVGRDVQALRGAQHGDRGRDDAVAEEERGADDHEDRDGADLLRAMERGLVRHQCEKRHDPAFALVVGAHQEREVT